MEATVRSGSLERSDQQRPFGADLGIEGFISYLAGCPIIDAFADLITVFEPETGAILFSTAQGFETDEAGVPSGSRRSLFDHVAVESRLVIEASLERIRETGEPHQILHFEFLFGSRRHCLEHRLFLPVCRDGELALLLSSNDAELIDAREKLRESEETHALALRGSFDGVWDWRIRTHEVLYSDRNREMLGYDREEFPDAFEAWSSLVHPEDLGRVLSEVSEHLATGRPYEAIFRIRARDGTWRWWRGRGQCVWDERGQPVRVVGTNSDITELMTAQEQAREALERLRERNRELEATKSEIEHAARHDALTGLANRRYLAEVSARMARELPAGGALAILQIDLDGFKQVNDTLGHAAGDVLLQEVSSILLACIGPHEFVSRTGGDEFVIVSSDGRDEARMSELARTLTEQLSRTFRHGGKSCRIGASVGMAIACGAGIDPEQLLINADIALYRAKGSGRHRTVVFSGAMQDEIVARKELADDLACALEDGEFEPYFQPQFAAGDLALIGVEALVRWIHPVRGIAAPGSFLPLAEELGMVQAIDRMVLEKACREVASLRAAGVAIPQLAVNVSQSRLADPDLLEAVTAVSAGGARLAFEIVESVFLDERDPAIDEAFERLRSHGIAIELDDFGSGRTSIISLLALRPERIKIDRQLVSRITEDPSRLTLLRSIIDMAKALGIGVLAEGVEALAELDLLRELGCEAVQGFALARPMSAPDLATFLAERTRTEGDRLVLLENHVRDLRQTAANRSASASIAEFAGGSSGMMRARNRSGRADVALESECPGKRGAEETSCVATMKGRPA